MIGELAIMWEAGDDSVSGRAARYITQLIKENNMAPGDRISSERELSERLGVGRPAVREALKTINALGLVEIRQYDGVYVASPEDTSLTLLFKVQMDRGRFDLSHLFEASRLFERETAALAVRHITGPEIGRLRTAAWEAGLDDAGQFFRSDGRFHSLIYKATGNVFLRSVMEVINELTLPCLRMAAENKKNRELARRDHLEIVAAFEERSEEKSREAMVRHIEHLQKFACG